jgi:hypothetical protein
MKDNFDVHKWNYKRYLKEAAGLDIDQSGGTDNVNQDDEAGSLNITRGGDDPKIGAELESGAIGDRVAESKDYLESLVLNLTQSHPDLDFEVSNFDDVRVYGSQGALMKFGNKMHGEKFGEYEVFHTDDDDQGEIVRIVRSSSILRENVKEGVVKDMHTFLNNLRDSGVTNMFGAAPYLQKEFGIDQKSARQVLANWMQSFSENLNYKDRKFSNEEEDRLDLIAHREFNNDFSKLSDEDKAKVFAKRDQVGVKETVKETLRFIKEHNPDFTNEEIKAELEEIKELGKQLNEKLCKKGEAYRKRRMAAGEKSSAYLSGRAVKVCKGQMSGKKKKKTNEQEEKSNRVAEAALILPRGEKVILQAEEQDYKRGLIVELTNEGGYKINYWYGDDVKVYPAEVEVDGVSIKDDANEVYIKFHPELEK